MADSWIVGVTLIFLGWKISEEAVEAIVVVPVHPVECGLLNVREGREGAGLEGRSVADRFVFKGPITVSAAALSYASPTLPIKAVRPSRATAHLHNHRVVTTTS